jgi:hypothetical protein
MHSLVLDAPAVPQSARQKSPAGSRLIMANCFALLAVAVFFRCWHLENIAGVNGDEAWLGVQALMLLGGVDIAWLTPTGNPVNPFFIMPLVGLHYFFAPSIIVLRLTALVSGLAALVANYVLCDRAFDRRTAIVSTMILALLPIDVAYSRFAWDASQSVLATLFVMYLPLIALRNWSDRATVSAATIMAVVAAVLVHPTNVFAVMLVIVPALYVRRRRTMNNLRLAALPAKTWALALLVAAAAGVVALAALVFPVAVGRLHGPSALGPFLANYLRLFSGTTVYEFISGAGGGRPGGGWFGYTTMACNAGFGLLAVAAIWGLVRRSQPATDAVDACLVIGWLTMLAAFFLVAGPEAIAPHFERYGMCLIAPGALVLARGLDWWIGPARGQRPALALALAAWLWPASFYVNYFQCFLETGGLSHYTFRTAAVEPKQAALRYILEHRRAGHSARVICRQWWNYWPVDYLAFREPHMRVWTWDEWRRSGREIIDRDAEETWFIEFAATEDELETLRLVRAAGRMPRKHVILDYARRPVIVVIGAEKVFQNR